MSGSEGGKPLLMTGKIQAEPTAAAEPEPLEGPPPPASSQRPCDQNTSRSTICSTAAPPPRASFAREPTRIRTPPGTELWAGTKHVASMFGRAGILSIKGDKQEWTS